jgi:UDP-glucose 4-epimerase
LTTCPAAVGQVFNVGNDNEISINDLAALVRERTNSQSSIVHVSYDDAYATGFEDLHRRVPDLTKLQRTIDYRPSTSITTIIDRIAS